MVEIVDVSTDPISRLPSLDLSFIDEPRAAVTNNSYIIVSKFDATVTNVIDVARMRVEVAGSIPGASHLLQPITANGMAVFVSDLYAHFPVVSISSPPTSPSSSAPPALTTSPPAPMAPPATPTPTPLLVNLNLSQTTPV